MCANKLYFITEKYPNSWETMSFFYVAVGRDLTEIHKLCDLDIPTNYNLEVIKEVNGSPGLLLDVRICYACYNIEIFKISKEIKKYAEIITTFNIYRSTKNMEALRNILRELDI